MDTTAEEIRFDDDCVCNFCHYFDEYVKPVIERSNSEEGRKLLDEMVCNIKSTGRNKPFDSILGLSGGTDSSYLAYLATHLGLRPLVVHVNTGWNSPESEANVRNVVEKLGLELYVFTIDWDKMRDLQIAFYKASVKNCEIPQDHAFLAALYIVAEKYHSHYILNGGNLASESILPKSWGYNAADLHHLLAIQKRYGTVKLRQFPTMGFWQRYIYYPFLKGIKKEHLLNLIPYNGAEAKRTLAKEFGWEDYGAKHCESVLTRFFQGYYLPSKFGIDKRKAHLSSLILSGQITREKALDELKKPPYQSDEQLQADKTYIAHKLGLSLSEWEEIISLPPRDHAEFRSSRILFGAKDRLVESLRIRK
jgi:N-acetyl sugar amidotransferase